MTASTGRYALVFVLGKFRGVCRGLGYYAPERMVSVGDAIDGRWPGQLRPYLDRIVGAEIAGRPRAWGAKKGNAKAVWRRGQSEEPTRASSSPSDLLPVRPARLATIATSSLASTGFDTWAW